MGDDTHTLINTQKVYGLAWYHGRGAGNGKDSHSQLFYGDFYGANFAYNRILERFAKIDGGGYDD